MAAKITKTTWSYVSLDRKTHYHLWNSFVKNNSTGQCGSVDWVSWQKAKGCWFNTQSGRMPRVHRFSPRSGCVQEKPTNRCFSLTLMFLSFYFSLPSPLSKNKQVKSLKIIISHLHLTKPPDLTPKFIGNTEHKEQY